MAGTPPYLTLKLYQQLGLSHTEAVVCGLFMLITNRYLFQTPRGMQA